MTKHFKVTAKGLEVNLYMDVEVDATEECLSKKVSAAKNVIFDMLRTQDFDVDKINIGEKENG